MSLIHCKLPNAGLGNQLFPIVNAYYFGKLNNLPVITSRHFNRLKRGILLKKNPLKKCARNIWPKINCASNWKICAGCGLI
jgi:hypothetical protein